MRRLLLFAFLPLVLLSLAAYALRDRGPRLLAGPWLQHPTTDSVVVLWETSEPTWGTVRFGRGVPFGAEATDDRLATLHEVRLEGLAPGATWRYAVRSRTPDGRTVQTEPRAFAPAPLADGAASFAVVGDTQDQPKVWSRIAAAVWAHRPALLVHCGDIVGDGHDDRRWREEFFAPARELLAGVPFLAVLGNHDADAPAYYRYVAHAPPEHRVALRYGPVHFFLVDSDRSLQGTSEQSRWLDGALARSTATWKVVVLHRPPWSSDLDDFGDARSEAVAEGDPRAQALIPLLEARGVDLVLCGHVHSYERTWPVRAGRIDDEGGVTYVQTGGAGGNREAHAPARSWFTAHLAAVHHFLILNVLGRTLDLKAYDVDGRMFDHWTRTKPEPASRSSRWPEPTEADAER